MAECYFTVFKGANQVAAGDPVNEGSVTVGSEADSGVMHAESGQDPCYVRIVTEQDCFVTWGTAPTAANDGTSGRRLFVGVPEYFMIPAHYAISVIDLTS